MSRNLLPGIKTGSVRLFLLRVGIGAITLITLIEAIDQDNPSSSQPNRLEIAVVSARQNLAQATITPTDSSYPALIVTSPLAQPTATPPEAGYPAPQETSELEPPRAYPVDSEGRSLEPAPQSGPPQQPEASEPGSLPAITSEQTKDSQPSAPDTEEVQNQESNTLFLWGGFVAALLIFASGVYGSIILFARKGSR